jgi:hypothetical protein
MTTYLKKTILWLFTVIQTSHLISAQLKDPIPKDIRCQQLIHGPSVLVVTIRPGDEDFEGLSLLRQAYGARISFLHLTNGESVPSTVWPWDISLIAACRKDEAVRSAHVFGGNSYFLNIPDGVVDSSSLISNWNSDSLAIEIASVIKSVKPHLLLFNVGAISTIDNFQASIIEGVLLKAADRCSNGEGSERNILSTSSRWKVQCLASTGYYQQRKKRYPLAKIDLDQRQVGSLSKKARDCYKSLAPFRLSDGANTKLYTILRQVSTTQPSYMIDRLQLTTPRLYAMHKIVQTAGRSIIKGQSKWRNKVGIALDSISACLKIGLQQFSELDQRALVNWKGDLDYFHAIDAERCFGIIVSDSILTERQVFFIGVKIQDSTYRQGTNQILFHKNRKEDWVINESMERVFDLNRDSLFRILTPERLSYTVPTALYGINQLTLEEPFRFSLIHEGKTRMESFIITKEVSIRYSSRHASVVQTPIVPISEKSILILDSYNFSRDPVDATLFVKDSICWSDTIRFTFSQKDEVRRDTFRLHFREDLRVGDYPLVIRSSRHIVGSCVARLVSNLPQVNFKIAVISNRGKSLLDDFFQMSEIQYEKFSPDEISDTLLHRFQVAIIDRETQIPKDGISKHIEEWTKQGGRIITLPQYFTSYDGFKFLANTSLNRIAPRKLNTMLAENSLQVNIVSSKAIVHGIIECHQPSYYQGLITTQEGQLLIAMKKVGLGTVILSAIDLDFWIAQLDLEAHQLMRKLILFNE